jgi:ubiquinone/menaquinone biosynthesis C-methylase UbiE
VSILDSTSRFSSRVANYVRYRPGYPSEALQTLKNECGLTSAAVIADVGSGTGFLSKLFLENQNRVYGIEPNKDMREAGETVLKEFPRFVSVSGTAEATTLPEHSVDFVTAGQAAHWFDAVRARREFVRILKPEGWVVLVWNDRSTDATPLLREYDQLLHSYCPEYGEVLRQSDNQVEAFFAPVPVSVKIFPSRQEFDYPGLEGRLLSSSYAPLADHPGHTPMLRELRAIFERYQSRGRVAFEYETRMFYAQVQRLWR